MFAIVMRVMLMSDGGAYLQRHVPVAHEPAADLVPIDCEQMLVHQPGRHVGVGLHMSADELEMRREDIGQQQVAEVVQQPDRKSTRLNSSHVRISYAVFCLKKKKKTTYTEITIPTVVSVMSIVLLDLHS